MTLTEVFQALDERLTYLEREGDRLRVHVCFPDRFPLTTELEEELRQHKPELLVRLRWEEEADRILLESTRRLAAEWPQGCTLEDAEWNRIEDALTEAYRAADQDELQDVIRRREELALQVFRNFKERAQ